MRFDCLGTLFYGDVVVITGKAELVVIAFRVRVYKSEGEKYKNKCSGNKWQQERQGDFLFERLYLAEKQFENRYQSFHKCSFRVHGQAPCCALFWVGM